MATTLDAPQNNSSTSLMRIILSLRGPQQQAFFSALSECSDQLRADADRLMSIVDDEEAHPGERRAWYTLLDQFHLLSDSDGRYGMDLAKSESQAAERFSALATEVNRMDTQEAVFAEKLRQIMKDKHITQKQLAERISCSQPAISQMLSRKCRPQRSTLEKIALALSVNVRELWPDIEVVDCLDTIAAAESGGYQMNEAEAAALRDTNGPRSTIKGKPLRSRKDVKTDERV